MFWETFSEKENIDPAKFNPEFRNLHVDWVKFADWVMRIAEVGVCKHSKNVSERS